METGDAQTECRHYGGLTDAALVICHRKGVIVACLHCQICPKCSGPTVVEREMIDILRDRTRWLIFETCVFCGLRTIGTVVDGPPLISQQPAEPGKCSVDQCCRGAYEGYTHDGMLICAKHQGQIKMWRNRQMSPERFPFYRVGNRLCENHLYRKQMAKRR